MASNICKQSGKHITINNDPSAEELLAAYDSIDTQIGALAGLDSAGFVDAMQSEDLLFFPVIISADGVAQVVIWLDDYDAAVKTCRIHFLTSPTIKYPRAVAVIAQTALDLILADDAIDVIFGFIERSNVKGWRCAQRFGFEEFAESDSIIYMSRSA